MLWRPIKGTFLEMRRYSFNDCYLHRGGWSHKSTSSRYQLMMYCKYTFSLRQSHPHKTIIAMTLPLSPTLNDDIYMVYPLRVYFIGQYPSIHPKHIYDTLTKYWVYQLTTYTYTHKISHVLHHYHQTALNDRKNSLCGICTVLVEWVTWVARSVSMKMWRYIMIWYTQNNQLYCCNEEGGAFWNGR